MKMSPYHFCTVGEGDWVKTFVSLQEMKIVSEFHNSGIHIVSTGIPDHSFVFDELLSFHLEEVKAHLEFIHRRSNL